MRQATSKLQKVLSKTGGRFFGLHTRKGESINAQSATVTPCFVNLVDNNTGLTRRIPHADVSHITVGGRRYSV